MRLLKIRIKRAIAVIGDLHAGCPYAAWPENFIAPTGYEIKPSDGQKIINRYLVDFTRICEDYEVDTIFLLGDMIDGNNRKEYGTDRLTTDLNLQIAAAKMLLTPLCEGRNVYGVHGTPYHDSLDMKADKLLIEQLGGTYWGALKNAKIGGTNLVFNLCHGVKGGTIYRSTKMDRELLFVLAAEAAQKIDFHIDLFIRGHFHFYGEVAQEANRFLQVPCWCDWIPYPPSLSLYGRMQPDIGGAIILIHEDDTITVVPKTYPLPGIAQRPVDA